MNPLDAMLRTYVAPLMKEEGFAKTGRLYQLTADNGDLAILAVEVESSDAQKVVFLVELHIVPLTHWEWVTRRSAAAKKPDLMGTLVQKAIVPPREVALEPDGEQPFNERWVLYKESDGAVCGQALARKLRDEVIPLARWLVVRENLLEELRTRSRNVMFRIGDRRGEVLLLVDDGPVDEVNRLLSDIEDPVPEANMVGWLRDRFTARLAKAAE